MYSCFIKTKIGTYLLTTDEQHITGLSFVKKTEKEKKSYITNKKTNISHPMVKKTITELKEYMDGKRKIFTVPIELQGTGFQQKVWREIQKVPYGKTVSYKQIAEQIGLPKAIRAVGNAVGKNPVSIIVPCHRVILHNSLLGGYANGAAIKKALLSLEGIKRCTY